MIKKPKYDDLLSFDRIENVYHTIRTNTKHREKIVRFETYYSSNVIAIYTMLKSKCYKHGKYSIFLVKEPKYRIIMSENMYDKVINHVVSRFVLFPAIEPRLIDVNVATRIDKGTKMGVYYVQKFINSIKENSDKIYALKCDIHKFFYSIDHEILFEKLKKIIDDPDLLNFLKSIIDSTDEDYINDEIQRQINLEKERLRKLNLSVKELSIKYGELDKLPRYQKGKGLPIGNMSSQIMAIFYMNNIDHFIKEKLKVKHYVRYMDDLIIFGTDKKELMKILHLVEEKISDLKLNLNNKTQIYEAHKGIPFLGYKFVVKNQRLYTLVNKQTKVRIKKKWSRYRPKDFNNIKSTYNGYLHRADSGAFVHKYYLRKYYRYNKKTKKKLLS